MFSNGDEVVKYVIKTISEIYDGSLPYIRQPISLLLLDINMPILNGLETLVKVKSIFEEYNSTQSEDLQNNSSCYLLFDCIWPINNDEVY